jgi:hypothetical protein
MDKGFPDHITEERAINKALGNDSESHTKRKPL